MNRKLLLLDIVLGACVIYAGFQLHDRWVAAKARQATMPGVAPPPAPPPVVPPLPHDPAVLASGFKDVAMKTLFEPSRNPDVVPPPPPPPPPPKDPPPLPSFHGMMDFGDGPFAMMTESGASGYREVHVGGMIGPFKLLAFSRREFDVEWEGRRLHKRIDEAAPERPRTAGGQAVEPITNNGVIPGQAPEQPLNQQQPQKGPDMGPGSQVTDTTRACQAGDGTAPGTVSDGYRKVVRMTALGASQCFWTAAGK